jgi:hypothetical protein
MRREDWVLDVPGLNGKRIKQAPTLLGAEQGKR